MERTTAGGSAAAKARELREKAARLEEAARQWDKGAEGERRTAAVLSVLATRGYVVLDDLAIPGSKANIDHVVIGPTGVVVVETKAYTGNITLRDGVLWHGRYPLRREMGAAQFEADKVREVVASTGWSVSVRSLVCLHGVDVPGDPTGSLAPIELCGPLDLLARIESAAHLLTPAHVTHLAALIETALPPQRIPTPVHHLVPPAEPPLAAVAPARLRGRVGRGRPRSGRIARSSATAARTLGVVSFRIVVVVIGAALAMGIVSAALDGLAEQATTTTTTTVPIEPAATAAPAVP